MEQMSSWIGEMKRDGTIPSSNASQQVPKPAEAPTSSKVAEVPNKSPTVIHPAGANPANFKMVRVVKPEPATEIARGRIRCTIETGRFKGLNYAFINEKYFKWARELVDMGKIQLVRRRVRDDGLFNLGIPKEDDPTMRRYTMEQMERLLKKRIVQRANPEKYNLIHRQFMSVSTNPSPRPIVQEKKATPVTEAPFDMKLFAMFAAQVNATMGEVRKDEKLRAVHRDRSKGLGIKGQGFPQGLNISPFLSCLKLMRVLGDQPGLVMYMDDGLIYGPSKAIVLERIRRFEERISTIGLSLSLEKSGWIREELEIKSFRFLGLRLEKGIFRSETRKGVQESLVRYETDFEEYDKLGAFYGISQEDRLNAWLESWGQNLPAALSDSVISNSKVRSWLLNKAKDKTAALKWALDKGWLKLDNMEIGISSEATLRFASAKRFLSNLVANSFMKSGTEEQVRASNRGTVAAWKKIRNASGKFVWGILTKILKSGRAEDPRLMSTMTSQANLELMKRFRRRAARKGTK